MAHQHSCAVQLNGTSSDTHTLQASGPNVVVLLKACMKRNGTTVSEEWIMVHDKGR